MEPACVINKDPKILPLKRTKTNEKSPLLSTNVQNLFINLLATMFVSFELPTL
jgi:hypothetical protein